MLKLVATALLVFSLVWLQGCIFVPRTEMLYDEKCQVMAKEWTLRPEQIGSLGSCRGKDCAVVLVALGLVAAASAVVSGSIVIAGNIVHWVEKQGPCARADAMPASISADVFRIDQRKLSFGA